MNYLAFVGRILIGLPFAMSGLSKLAAYGPTTAKIAAVRLLFPSLAFAVAVAVELGGGLLLVLGYRVRPVALGLAFFSLATAVSSFGAGVISIDNRRKDGEPSSSPAVAA